MYILTFKSKSAKYLICGYFSVSGKTVSMLVCSVLTQARKQCHIGYTDAQRMRVKKTIWFVTFKSHTYTTSWTGSKFHTATILQALWQSWRCYMVWKQKEIIIMTNVLLDVTVLSWLTDWLRDSNGLGLRSRADMLTCKQDMLMNESTGISRFWTCYRLGLFTYDTAFISETNKMLFCDICMRVIATPSLLTNCFEK